MSDRYEDREREKQGLYVRVKNNDVNKAMRKLKKMMTAEGIFQELRKREFYEPPSIRRKREKAQAVKRWKKKQEEISKNL
jgi:small subunit ribosomal protein S21